MPLGPVMLDIAGTELTPEDRELLRHPNVGGVVLFARNHVEPGQLAALVAEIHGLREPHLLVAVDQEGGRVQRFVDGFTRLPPMAALGERFEVAPREAVADGESLGWLLAAELLARGVDLSFAPVLDLRRGISDVIGDRAFHNDPEVVATLGGAVVRGMRAAGMSAVGKHFPGHGSVAGDSHHVLPVDRRDRFDVLQLDAVPFSRLIHKGLPGVMAAHVVYPAVDAAPAGYSRAWLQDALREEIGFAGAIFSDDLSMAGADAGEDLPQRATRTLEAGCDMALVCNDRPGAARVVEGLPVRDRPASVARLMRMHGHAAAGIDEGLAGTRAWAEARARVDALVQAAAGQAGDAP